MQEPLPFMLPNNGEQDFQLPSVSDMPSWEGAGRVCIDIETKDPDLTRLGPGVRRGAEIVGIGFAIEDGPAHYLPMAHRGGDNLDPTHVIQYIKDQARSFRGDLVGANLQYDLDFLAHIGINFRPRFFRDVQVAEPLIDEHQFSYSLENIAGRYGLQGKDEDDLRNAAKAYGVNPKKEMWKLPGRFVHKYAIQDVVLPLQLIRRQERIIDEQELWDIYNLESKLIPVLLDMRRLGVRIDVEKLNYVEKWSVEQEREALKIIYEESNVRINIDEINKDDPILMAFRACGIQLKKTTEKGKLSLAADVLDQLDHPVAKAVLRARKFNKLRNTFCRSIQEHMVNGRIHCSFHQLKSEREDGKNRGTVSGRLSATDPNLQQQYSRDSEIAPVWRGIYIPEDGEQWACLDYSQQEPRWAVHFAEVCGLPKSHIVGDRYRNDPLTDNHTMIAQMVAGQGDDYTPTKKERGDGKIIFLGLLYSMGGAKLCDDMGYPTKWKKLKNGKWIRVAGPQGQSVIDRFDRQVPFAKKLAQRVKAAADERGYIKTVLGRRCRFPLDKDGKNRLDTRKALNRLIQGSSADQMKKAMIDAHEAGHRFMLQVHDELDASVRDRKHAEEIADVMRHSVKMTVPARVDVELGPNWGNVK